MSNFDNFTDMDFNKPMTAEAEKEFILLDPGIYPFTVVDIVKARHEPNQGSTLPPCPKVTLTLEVKDPEGNVTRIKQNLFYCEKMKWQIDNAFIGTGKAKEGETYTPNPDLLVGATGYCEVEQSPSYKDPNKIYNQVKKILREAPATATTDNFGGF